MAISINLRRSFLRSGVSFGQYFTYTMRLPLETWPDVHTQTRINHGHITTTALPTALPNKQPPLNTKLHPRPHNQITKTLQTINPISTHRNPPALHLLLNPKRLLNLQPAQRRPTRLRLSLLPKRPAEPPLHSILLPLFPAIFAPRSRFPRPLQRRQILSPQCAFRPA